MEFVTFQFLTNVCIQMCTLGGKKSSDKLGKDKQTQQIMCWLLAGPQNSCAVGSWGGSFSAGMLHSEMQRGEYVCAGYS